MYRPGLIIREADTIPTDDRDRVTVIGIGLLVGTRVRVNSFVGTKSVGIEWCTGTPKIGEGAP